MCVIKSESNQYSFHSEVYSSDVFITGHLFNLPLHARCLPSYHHLIHARFSPNCQHVFRQIWCVRISDFIRALNYLSNSRVYCLRLKSVQTLFFSSPPSRTLSSHSKILLTRVAESTPHSSSIGVDRRLQQTTPARPFKTVMPQLEKHKLWQSSFPGWMNKWPCVIIHQYS